MTRHSWGLKALSHPAPHVVWESWDSLVEGPQLGQALGANYAVSGGTQGEGDRTGSKLTKGAASDGVIKVSDTGAAGSQVQVILVLQALEQVSMLLEYVAQRTC